MTAGRLKDGEEVKPFLEHLEELRHTIIRSALVLGIAMAVAIPLTPQILDLLKAPLAGTVEDPDRFLRSIEVSGAFVSTLRMAFWSGLVMSAPFICFFVGQFIFPGLKQAERSAIYKASGFAVLLFIFGVVLAYKITLPVALSIMLRMHEWLGIEAEWTITSYIAFSMQLLIAFGLAFELPVVIMVLAKLGLVNSDQLRDKRRYVIVILLIVAMLLTPPDVFTQLMMAVPLILLYELCIWLVRAQERRSLIS
ncbi:MAG: twin-arginine translocase subunit TatC [Verrucomicrobia bacterium]|nr:twin-arginine translocase subunit TatC [Verrucomicrobiota bacterium]